MVEQEDLTREDFEFFSREYAEALKAFHAIENQASTILLMGGSTELREFIEQFLNMASRTRALAVERDQGHFAEWFAELIAKAENLLAQLAGREPPRSH
jgi:hypothetical protein